MDSELWSFSAVGQDRPGIVAALTKLFYEHDCNLSDSQMTQLAGQFAVVLLFETGAETEASKLREAVDELGREWHLLIQSGPVENQAGLEMAHTGASHIVSVYGADQAGITWKVAERVAHHGYNVTDLSTKRIEGAAPVYILMLEIEATEQSASTEKLEQSLQTLGKELGCSVTLKQVESSQL